MKEEARSTAIQCKIVRLDAPTRESYDNFRERFENAVPTFDRDRAVELIERKAPWSEVVNGAAAAAPYDFLLYWKLDLSPLMSLAGNKRRATEYLMGNHVIAETMYRHDPAVGLYVPLRCLIYEADEGARFAIDQPSTILSSFGRDEITLVGKDLDQKLVRLFDVLGLATPAALLQAPREAGTKVLM